MSLNSDSRSNSLDIRSSLKRTIGVQIFLGFSRPSSPPPCKPDVLYGWPLKKLLKLPETRGKQISSRMSNWKKIFFALKSKIILPTFSPTERPSPSLVRWVNEMITTNTCPTLVSQAVEILLTGHTKKTSKWTSLLSMIQGVNLGWNPCTLRRKVRRTQLFFRRTGVTEKNMKRFFVPIFRSTLFP